LERDSPSFYFSTQTEIHPRARDLTSPAHRFSVALPRIFYCKVLVRLQTRLAFCYRRPRLWFCWRVFLLNWISVLSHFLDRARRVFSDCHAPVDFPPSMLWLAFSQIYFHGLAQTHFLCVWISRPYYSLSRVKLRSRFSLARRSGWFRADHVTQFHPICLLVSQRLLVSSSWSRVALCAAK
jgi:hypothetical protein